MIKHLAIVMDGNRRWATQRGMAKWLGHYHGAQAVEHAINFCLGQKIKFLSLYTFSLENLKRSEEEKNYIFSLITKEAQHRLPQFIQNNVRIKFIGDKTLFPEQILPTINEVEQATVDCDSLQVNFLFCYGGQQEIFWGIKSLLQKVQTGELKQEELTPQLFEECLWTYTIPEPEIIVRTGGKNRLSNFLLYKAAYSELFFLNEFWPEITKDHLQKILTDYQEIQRNFGA